MKEKSITSPQKEHAEELAPDQALLTEPSDFHADGIHFTVEWRILSLPAPRWERIEYGWEVPDPFVAHWQAEAAARVLALRADGARAYRVVNPRGRVLQVFWVKKWLAVFEARLSGERGERVPAGFDAPMLAEVLTEKEQRSRVYLSH